jgi:hypothetical protein
VKLSLFYIPHRDSTPQKAKSSNLNAYLAPNRRSIIMLCIKSLYVLPSSAIRSRHSFFFPRRLSYARCLRNVLAERIQLKAAEELNSVQWIQKLLNETEGGGYQLGKFGMVGHDVAWGDMVGLIEY